MSAPISRIQLKPRSEKRLRSGNLWVYSNEVDTKATPLKNLEPGELVDIFASKGFFLGRGTVNPSTLISARVLRRDHGELDEAFFHQRFASALAFRKTLYSTPFYRLVHSEADGLPGLIVDRFDDTLVMEVNTAGMEKLRDIWEPALLACTGASQLVEKRNSSGRQLEGLDTRDLPAEPQIAVIPENDVRIHCDLNGGQKTGYFFDQRPHREWFARLAPGKSVLDVFSYVGAWGLGAAKARAQSVLCVDSSASALEQLQSSANENSLQVETRCQDALEALRELRDAGRSFDLIVVDPPALIKRKKDYDQGREHYARLNHVALQCLAPGGVLFASSCSHHMPAEVLAAMVQREAAKLGRELQLFHSGGAGPDHPVHPAMPETGYLKTFAFRCLARPSSC